MLSAALVSSLVALSPAPSGADAFELARSIARAGQRPAGGAGERRAQARIAERFRGARLRVV